MIKFFRNLFSVAGGMAIMIYIVVIVMAFAGWVMNVFKIIPMLDDGFSAWLIARLVGVFAAPLGALLGWF